MTPASTGTADREALARLIAEEIDEHRQGISTCSCGEWTPYGEAGTTFAMHLARAIAAVVTVSEEPLSGAGERELLREAVDLLVAKLDIAVTGARAGHHDGLADMMEGWRDDLRAALAATPAPAEGREAVREAEGIDVERLAGAICNAEAVRYEETYRYADFDEWGREGFREEARRVATEYAALARTGGSTDGE